MKMDFGRTVYILAAIAVVIIIGLTIWNRGLNEQLQESQSVERTPSAVEPDRAEERAREAEAQKQDALEAELAGAQARIEELESQVAKASAPAVPPAETEAPEAEAPPEEEEPEAEKASLDEVREKIVGNAQVSAQMRALMEMAYADLFAELSLDLDIKAALREVLLGSQLEQIALARYAMALGDVGYLEQYDWVQDERALLALELKELLAAEDYAAWEEYERSLEERMLEATFRNQLSAFSSGLTPENYELVLQIALEEFMAEQDALRESDVLFSEAESLLYQLRAMSAMRERLIVLLTEDQYAELDNWLTMGENVIQDALPDDAL